MKKDENCDYRCRMFIEFAKLDKKHKKSRSSYKTEAALLPLVQHFSLQRSVACTSDYVVLLFFCKVDEANC
ncbi:hypothetical protein, partial [Treponema berlinense]|uniref:hypothetical protein n=1 Tax=Treponema berlinense TaxID=225004 RepID=UPI002354CA96